MPRRTERGAAVVDIVLVMVVLVPVVLGILQVALVLYVHNTLASAASEGARLAATRDRGPADGAALTRAQIDGRGVREVRRRTCPRDRPRTASRSPCTRGCRRSGSAARAST